MVEVPVNKNASKEVKSILNYFKNLHGKGILTGQHTLTMEQEELEKIFEVTGKLPALCGFELLSYSPNIRPETGDEACVTEIERNKGTLKKAWEWAEKGGLITFTWHWYSPIGGVDKSFYAKNTDFDAREAIKPGTPENKALYHDMDVMAEILKEFRDKHVPILWRPFHEAEGDWFWWGNKGVLVAAELFRMMYRYFTEVHELNNLIWVWNSPAPEGYVGDNYCDIVSRDQYPAAHEYGAFEENYEGLMSFAGDKGLAIAETGIIPDADALVEKHIPWLWYMTWSGGFVLSEEFNEFEALKRLYHHEYAVTLDKLPKLYRVTE